MAKTVVKRSFQNGEISADPLADIKRDRTTHGTVARINIERGKEGSINLRLAQWALSPDAWMTYAEANKLIAALQAAMKPAKTAIVAADDYEDMA